MAKRNTTTVRNPEYPGDQVGRPEDERQIAERNFRLVPRSRSKSSTPSGKTPEKRSLKYWRKVRRT